MTTAILILSTVSAMASTAAAVPALLRPAKRGMVSGPLAAATVHTAAACLLP